MKKLSSLIALLALSIWLISPALAGECESDDDCPAGFECAEADFPTQATPAPTPAEPPKETDEDPDEAPDEDSSSDAESKEAESTDGDGGDKEHAETSTDDGTWSWCQPKACEADADCDGGTVCVLHSWEECSKAPMRSGGAVPTETPDAPPPGEENSGGDSDDTDEKATPSDDPKDEDPETSDCETVTEGFCGPQWLAPCEVATDCGPAGFECVEVEECWGKSGGSRGSAGSTDVEPVSPDGEPTEDAGDSDSKEEPGDTDDEGDDEDTDEEWDSEGDCEPTGEFACEVVEIECSTDADCPEDFTCEEMFENVAVSDAPCAEGDDDCGEPEVVEPEVTSACLPAGYLDYVGWGGGAAAMTETASRDKGTGDGANVGGEGPQDPSPPGADDLGATEATDGDEDAESAPASKSSDDGCLGGPNPVGLGWTALALLGLALARRRRIAA